MKEKLTFEDNMTKLGKIVTELEKGDIPLEKAVELYQQAAEKGVENGVNHLNRLIEEGKIVKEYRIVEK